MLHEDPRIVRIDDMPIEGTVESKASTATTAVANLNDAPTGAVTISGTATQNQTLTAANTLADADGLGSIAYQWQSSADGTTWSAISGAEMRPTMKASPPVAPMNEKRAS